jgi:Uroporphyrinogen-III decarboxylase
MMPRIPADVMALGNISPAGEFRNGTSESIYAKTQSVMAACCKYPNFVISSGCDIPPLSPWSNIDSFFKAVGDFYS